MRLEPFFITHKEPQPDVQLLRVPFTVKTRRSEILLNEIIKLFNVCMICDAQLPQTCVDGPTFIQYIRLFTIFEKNNFFFLIYIYLYKFH